MTISNMLELPNAFTAEECQSIIDLGLSQDLAFGEVYTLDKDANNLTKTYKLPPYFAFVNPNSIPEEMRSEPPILRIVYNSNKIKDLAVL